jgi:hypothetical protein
VRENQSKGELDMPTTKYKPEQIVTLLWPVENPNERREKIVLD